MLHVSHRLARLWTIRTHSRMSQQRRRSVSRSPWLSSRFPSSCFCRPFGFSTVLFRSIQKLPNVLVRSSTCERIGAFFGSLPSSHLRPFASFLLWLWFCYERDGDDDHK